MAAFTGVVSRGIYCRRGCGGNPDPRETLRFVSAAAAEAAGYRACPQCRPYRSPQPMQWDAPELVCQAMQMIVDGALDGATEAELGARVGLSSRHLRRLFVTHLGATPDQVARSSRAHFARQLLDDTDLSITDIAFAAGFGSLRQLNRTCQDIFGAPPGRLRARRHRTDRLTADGGLVLRLPFEGPFEWDTTLDSLAAHAIAGVEHVGDDRYRRTIVVDGDPGVLEIGRGGADYLLLRAHLPQWAGLIHVVTRARRIVSLDAPDTGEPGAWDPFETGVREIVERDERADRTHAVVAALVARLGQPVPGLQEWDLTHTFPSPRAIADCDDDELDLTEDSRRALKELARATLA